MISHFSAIIVCLSGVYCISKFDNLSLNRLVRILSGEIAINEWQAAMDQDIIINKDAYGSKTLNVKNTVYNFWQRADYRAEAEFESIRSIIKMAYQCTLTKYASITAYLIFQELWETKTNRIWALNHTKLKTTNRDYERVFNELYDHTLRRENYILDFDFKLNGASQKIIEKHDYTKYTEQQKELHYLWAGLIEKKLRFKIKYKIYTDVMNTKFKNEYNVLLVFTEFAFVLNEVIQMLDNFILDKCVEHGKSFEKNFKSLKTGVQGDFMWLLRNFDEMNARNARKDGQYLKYNQDGNPYLEDRDSNWELYRDFTKSIPGAMPVHPEIKASGCFVENLEFEISDFKTSLANNINPTDIYGDNHFGSTHEIEMKLMETPKSQENTEVKVGMILFRDEDIQ